MYYNNGYTTPDSLISTNTTDFWSDLTNLGAGLLVLYHIITIFSTRILPFNDI